ncbi:MAG: hypothetical protein ACT6UH_09065 [Hydrogenophaga sp.]|uniref:hypothetical protein n=1 Tax=Hydrogenophaga sp. TaxID=1904254 RepID=UPI00403627D7
MNGNPRTDESTKNSVLMQGGVCAAIFAALSIAAAFSSTVHLGFLGYIALFLSGSVLTAIGVIVGDALRRMAMPDLYFTKGFADSIKKRIFWAIGPQAIGWFIGFVATQGFMQNYLGYDMKRGQGRVSTTASRVQLQGTTKPIDLVTSTKTPTGPVTRTSDDPSTIRTAKAFPLIEVGACVMGVHKQTATGMEFARTIPVFSQGGSTEPIGTMQTFSAFYTEEQHSITGRVRLIYAPGPFADEPKAGDQLGWVNADDLVIYDQRNCE